MKSILLKILLPFCFFVLISIEGLCQSVEGQDYLELSLQDAVAIALEKNPTIIIAGKEVEIKKQGKRNALWDMLPEASINGSYNYTIKKQTMAMDLGGDVQTFKVGMKHNYNGSLDLAVPLFAPALYKVMNISKHDVNLAIEKSRASEIDLINEVVKAYFQTLLSQDSYGVLMQSLKQAEDNFRIVSSKYDFGKVSEYDKIRAEVQMRNIRPSVIAAENAVRLAKTQLKVLLGLSSPAEVVIKDNLKFYQSIVSDNKGLYFIDLSNNSDLKQLDISENILKSNVKLQRTNYLPTLTLNYSYSYMSFSNKGDLFHYRWFPTSIVGVRLFIPLFRGGNMAKMKQSKIELAKIFYMREHAQRQLKLLASSYLDNMSASTEQLESNEVSVEQASKGREIARKMYEIGKGTILELNDSEVALVQAKLSYNQAIFDFLVAKSEYARVIGTNFLEEAK